MEIIKAHANSRKKILITSTDLMMIQFLVPHVKNLADSGYTVDIACSVVGDRITKIKESLDGYNTNVYTVRSVRSPLNIKADINGYNDLKRIINNGQYDIIWTNEPVMGVLTRLAAKENRKNGGRVIYMVHGFHFFQGAPLINWILFYPVERHMSKLCDVIVTINQEDYQRAKDFKTAKVKYIHGIGVDRDRFCANGEMKNIRNELGLTKDDFLMLTVGELLPRKNQQVIIKAMGLLQDEHIHYILCGKGNKQKKLQETAIKNGVDQQVHFLGYRTDLNSIYSQVDILAFPSKREGLGLAGLEAMLFGLPLITSNTSGPRDYMINGETGFMLDPNDAEGFSRAILKMKNNPKLREKCGSNNKKVVMAFDLEDVKKEILEIINEFNS